MLNIQKLKLANDWLIDIKSNNLNISYKNDPQIILNYTPVPNETYDTIIVGSGIAGMTSALFAQKENETILMLEASPDTIGGTTIQSSGWIWIPNNTFMNNTDLKDDALAYMARIAYPQKYKAGANKYGLSDYEYQMLEVYYDNGKSVMQLTKEKYGIEWIHVRDFAGNLWPDYYNVPENKNNRGRIVRIKDPKTGEAFTSGYKILMYLQGFIKNMTLKMDSEVSELINENMLKVGDKVYKANKKIIFATAGFARNDNLKEHNMHGHTTYGTCSGLYSKGALIDICLHHGYQLRLMNQGWFFEVIKKEPGLTMWFLWYDRFFVVNANGKRVYDEGGNYNERCKAHFNGKNNLILVYNSQLVSEFPKDYYINPKSPWVHTADSLEKLSTVLNSDVDLSQNFNSNVSETLNKYNEYCIQGVDKEFNRGSNPSTLSWLDYSKYSSGYNAQFPKFPNPALQPISNGPYYAIVLTSGMIDTKGGPIITSRCQIQGSNMLYASGNCVAHATGEGYFGPGSTWGWAMVSGMITGSS